MMYNILIAGIVGGITGVIGHLVRNKKILVFPKMRKVPKGIQLGFIADFLFGAAASIFAITYLLPNPEDLRTIIGISILAGMSAESILLRNDLIVERAKASELSNINERLKK